MTEKVYFVGPLERALYLRSLPALRHLDSGEIAAVAQYAVERFFSPDALLLRRGEPVPAFYLIIEGSVSLFGESTELGSVARRGVVGFLHLLAGLPSEIEVRAKTQTLALEFDATAQIDLCEEHFSILQSYVRYLSGLSIRHLTGAGTRAQTETRAPLPTQESLSDGPPDFVDRILVLRRTVTFQGCGLDALGDLCRHLEPAEIPAGQTLWRRGETETHFLVVASGLLEQKAAGGAVVSLGPGSVVGLHETLCARSRRFTVGTGSGATILRGEIEPFWDTLEDHPDLAFQFLSATARRLVEAGVPLNPRYSRR